MEQQPTLLSVVHGDLFLSDAQTIVNTVNTVGVMGKGVALEFRKRFPEMFQDYRRRCKQGEVKLGQPYLYKEKGIPYILNFPTKDHWRSQSQLKDVVHGLEYLKQHYAKWGISSLAVPALGCGLGGLEWRIVSSVLIENLKQLEIPVKLYSPR